MRFTNYLKLRGRCLHHVLCGPTGVSKANFRMEQMKRGLGVSGVVNVFYESDDPSAPSYSDEYQVLIGSSGAWPLAEEGPDVTGRVTMKKFYRLGQVLMRRVGELGR